MGNVLAPKDMDMVVVLELLAWIPAIGVKYLR
jgi:hypothetical protein